MNNEPVSTVVPKKRGFFKRHKENMKVIGSAGISISGIAAVIAMILLHVVNPATGIITVPFAFQAMLIVLIKKGPASLDSLRKHVQNIFKDEDPEQIGKFVDEVVSQYSGGSTQRTIPPASTPPETPREQKLQYNAYYSTSKQEIELTPRYPGQKLPPGY
jgi:hypothetical protein